ncbi:H/ACA ribonucleoprotein complex non-core subunit NAF1 [Emydura macquarii macquarii]|uniref:H/ACA ribonucleoprotein complex non-core subunit NAF1 n=1 Tax=Emydura macquarii macquarii TaxID=1129001 RepID=UPI00352AAD4C
MEVVAQLETLKVDNVPAPGSPSAGGPQPSQGHEGSEEQGQGQGQASEPAAGGAPGAEGLQEEQPGENSSDSDSDTDSDSSSSVSSSSCSLTIVSAEGGDKQNGKDNTSYHVKTKDELPPVEDLTIILPEDVELKPFGTVSSIVEQLVIIESLKGLPPVNEESIIFKGDRHAAGKIFEVFGPVLHPFYVLRFNNPEHIEAKGINTQDALYFAPSVEDFTQYIFTEKLKQEKGSDASWENDQEPPPEALDFSDDEMERQTKSQKKKKPQNQERKKLKSEMNESSENNGVQHQPVQQPTSNYSRGYRGREFNPGFSRDRFPHPSVNPSFSRPQLRPPHFYSSDHRIHQASTVFPQPHRQENPMMQQYPFPPPGFGPVGNQMRFPPPNLNMMWAGPNMPFNIYCPPFPPPPPPPPASPNGHPSQFRP